MRRALHRSLGAALLAGALAGTLLAGVPLGTPVHRFASPGNYPEGLAWDGAALWCNNYEDGTLYKVDPRDGHVLRRFQGEGLPAHPEGLAWDGQNLWTCDHFTGEIVKLRETPQGIQILGGWQKPDSSGAPVGLEWDGTNLWLATWFSDLHDKGELWKLDPVTLESRGMLRLPVWWVEDLAWDGHVLWSVDWIFGVGFAIDPATGDTLHTYSTPGPPLSRHPVGQAWDGQHLWVTDTESDSIWALDISAARTSSVQSVSWTDVKRLFGGR